MPRAEAAWDFLVLSGEMPGNGDDRYYRPPRPAQKPRGDFVVAGISLVMLLSDAAEEIRASYAGMLLGMLPSDAAFALLDIPPPWFLMAR